MEITPHAYESTQCARDVSPPFQASECITLLRTLQFGDKDKWAEGELKLRSSSSTKRNGEMVRLLLPAELKQKEGVYAHWVES